MTIVLAIAWIMALFSVGSFNELISKQKNKKIKAVFKTICCLVLFLFSLVTSLFGCDLIKNLIITYQITNFKFVWHVILSVCYMPFVWLIAAIILYVLSLIIICGASIYDAITDEKNL